MSFQHEVYPEETATDTAPGQELEERPLSRQVLIVQELEIRDRLASSQINKFLHLHTSERLPRRTHSNMVRGAWAAHVHLHALTQTVCVPGGDPVGGTVWAKAGQ